MPDDVPAAIQLLDTSARSDLPGRPPPLNMDVAVWAFGIAYRTAQALIYREVDEQAVRASFAVQCPAALTPAVCYSADLSFCILPDLISLARGLADDDPLLEELLALAARWPLSSVGVKSLSVVNIDVLVGDPSLRMLYVDRIIERSDVQRLNHPSIQRAVREALGAYPELSPTIAAALPTQKANL